MPILALGVVIAILYLGRLFFITSLVAVTIAFILEPFVALLMRIRFPRSLASFVVCTVALPLVYLIGLGAYTQLSGLYDELPKYGQGSARSWKGCSRRSPAMEQQTYQAAGAGAAAAEEERRRRSEQALPRQRRGKKGAAGAAAVAAPGAIPEVRIHEESTPIGDYIYARLGSFYQILLMASFVPFLVYFMLSWRDHINRSFLQFFHGEDRLVAARSLQGIADMVRAFVVGNFLLGLLLAVVSSTVFWMIRLPYPLLVGPLSGFLSLVPYIGLPLALIPPLFVALPLNAVSDLRPGGHDGRHAAPDRAEPALSEDRGIARAPESAGGDVFADALGLPVGRAGPAAGDSADRGDQGGLRQRQGAAAVRKVPGRLRGGIRTESSDGRFREYVPDLRYKGVRADRFRQICHIPFDYSATGDDFRRVPRRKQHFEFRRNARSRLHRSIPSIPGRTTSVSSRWISSG